MIRPMVPPEVWSGTCGVHPFNSVCENCGIEVAVNVPVAFDSWRGFASTVHEPCGKNFQIVRSVSLDPNIQQTLGEALNLTGF